MKTTYIAALVSLTVLGSKPAIEAQGEGPCGLLTTAEVQRTFPASKPGRFDRSMEKYGLLRCVWDYPGGSLLIIAGEENDTPKEEAKGLTPAFLDPLRADAERHVRYEVLAGVGDQAVAVIEREDKAKGFMTSAAILVVQRGKRQVSVMSGELARRDRAEALRALTEIGKAIAKRLS
jgi:hypothetical protein